MTNSFACAQCGKCCIEFGSGLSVSKVEIQKWENDDRYDILDHVFLFEYMKCEKCNKLYPIDDKICKTCGNKLEPYILGGDLWFDPETGEELDTCPFLEQLEKGKYVCLIHDAKPDRCKNFPTLISTECEECGLNFVKHFKESMFPELPLDEYLNWSIDDFYEKVLLNVDICPQCNAPIPKYHPWAIENCEAILHMKK
ncbi:MAG: hypothetical protein ACTSW1_17900 [Candidatus Hodarchaeales archaeon]